MYWGCFWKLYYSFTSTIWNQTSMKFSSMQQDILGDFPLEFIFCVFIYSVRPTSTKNLLKLPKKPFEYLR